MCIMTICIIQVLAAQNVTNQSNENNATFNLESLVSKWKQNSQNTSENINETKRQRANQLLKLGILYVENEDYAEAIDCLNKSADLYLDLNDEYYFYNLCWQCHAYMTLGLVDDYNAIKDIMSQAIDRGKISNEQIKLIVLSKYGEILKNEDKIDEAIGVAEKSLISAVEIYGTENPEIFTYLYKLCSLYLNKGDLSKSKDLIDNMKILNLKSQVDKTDYYGAIILESHWMQATGKIGEMIQLLEKNANEIENDYEFLEIKALMYDALTAAYSSLGNFQKSQLYGEKSLNNDRILYGEDSPYYATSLINLSDIYAVNGLKSRSLAMTEEALSIFEKLYGKKNEKYIKCLEALASIYSNDNPQKSKKIYHDCLILWESLYGQNSREYAESLIWSNLDFSNYPSRTSIANVKRGLEILKSLDLTNYEFYISLLNFYCTMLYGIEDYPNLYDASSELLNLIRNRIYLNFLTMTEDQRENFWKKLKPNIESIEQYAVCYTKYAIDNNDYSLINEYSGLGYDVRLLKKGLLLTSSRNIENTISKLDNQDINRLVIEISIQRNKLSNFQPKDNEYERIERICNNLERELLDLISSYNDFMKFTSIKWQDIQDVLMPGEVALEFFSYQCQNDRQYGVTFVGSEGNPRIIPLFIESELNKYLIDDTTVYDYKSPELYKTIWFILELFSDIKNAHTIYFSADGKLNTIAVENLSNYEGQLVSEKKNIVRLSSTRELLTKNAHLKISTSDNNQSHIVLYGGLDYNSPLPSLLPNDTANSKYVSTWVSPTVQRAFKNKAQYLHGTLKEVEELSRQLRIGTNADITQYTGSNGTERSINDLSNLHPSLLHIATHGFYYDEANHSSALNSSNENANSTSIESKAMKESGLLLSGANHTLMREDIEDKHNDGILTAEEISNISLGDVDLVVLSACETGLGSVSEEGVFGLQRGFKLSGVNCIMMSLWKVDDDATKELMIDFYNNLLKGSSKIEALKAAQKKLRETSGYDDPEYWAAFILLDGIN